MTAYLARQAEQTAVLPATDRGVVAVSATLTPRLRQVAELLGQGVTRREVADLLGISPTSVRAYDSLIQRGVSQSDGVPYPLTYALARDPDFALPRYRATARGVA